MTPSQAIAVVTAAGIALVLATSFHVRSEDAADDRSAQEERAAWFRSLKQPNTGMSCCDVSDCRRADVKPPSAASPFWRAQLPSGEWIDVPPEKILDRRSIDGEAYLCSGPGGTVYCFVPPAMAM